MDLGPVLKMTLCTTRNGKATFLYSTGRGEAAGESTCGQAGAGGAQTRRRAGAGPAEPRGAAGPLSPPTGPREPRVRRGGQVRAHGREKPAAVAVLTQKQPSRENCSNGQSGSFHAKTQEPTHQEAVTIARRCVPNIGAPEYVKQMLTGRKKGRKHHTIIEGDVNAVLSTKDGSCCQKLGKETRDRNYVRPRGPTRHTEHSAQRQRRPRSYRLHTAPSPGRSREGPKASLSRSKRWPSRQVPLLPMAAWSQKSVTEGALGKSEICGNETTHSGTTKESKEK